MENIYNLRATAIGEARANAKAIPEFAIEPSTLLKIGFIYVCTKK
jgi:hypothetical protein